jgi:hypothetical protein
MSENQIKVSNLEELLAKAREYVASQGGAEKVRIGKSSTSTGYWTHTKNGLVQSSKGGIAVELRGKNDSSIEFLLEDEGEEIPSWGSGTGKLSPKLLRRTLAELNKIVSDTRPEPPQNKTPDRENNFQPHSFSAQAIPCSSMEEVKKQVKDYYQKNQEQINKNPDFSQWIEITEIGLFSSYSEVDKNGKTITSGPHNTATISLKGVDRTENGKIINQMTNLLLKVKSSEWGEETTEIVC